MKFIFSSFSLNMAEKYFLNLLATFPTVNDDTRDFLIIAYSNYTVQDVL